jgi:hypothetical protein
MKDTRARARTQHTTQYCWIVKVLKVTVLNNWFCIFEVFNIAYTRCIAQIRTDTWQQCSLRAVQQITYFILA